MTTKWTEKESRAFWRRRRTYDVHEYPRVHWWRSNFLERAQQHRVAEAAKQQEFFHTHDLRLTSWQEGGWRPWIQLPPARMGRSSPGATRTSVQEGPLTSTIVTKIEQSNERCGHASITLCRGVRPCCRGTMKDIHRKRLLWQHQGLRAARWRRFNPPAKALHLRMVQAVRCGDERARTHCAWQHAPAGKKQWQCV